VVPAQQRTGGSWFKGSADAIHQSLNVITDEDPDHVAVFGGDHMYKMDVRQMVDAHLASEADATVAAIPVPVDEARAFGVIEVDDRGKVVTFDEKPQHPREIPGRPGWALASMGNYVFQTGALVEELARDASGNSAHDFGRNILPEMVARGRDVYVYDFSQNEIPGSHPNERGYWRDVGTIGAYWQANMDLTQVVPDFDLYNPRWPLRTWTRPLPPAKFVFADDGHTGHALDSMVCPGVIISGSEVNRSVISPNVHVDSYALVEGSVLFSGVRVGQRAIVRNAIVDKDVIIEPGARVGIDPKADRERFTISPGGVVVIPKGERVAAAT
jgi:glucose-1-phosphate adenylyltransferase